MNIETREIEFDYMHMPLEGLKIQIEECYKQLEKWQKTINKLHKRKAELQRTKLIRAGTWWKEGVYLYLVYPEIDGRRKREYIGADARKQSEALESIERAKEYDRIEITMMKINDWIVRAMYETDQLKKTLSNI